MGKGKLLSLPWKITCLWNCSLRCRTIGKNKTWLWCRVHHALVTCCLEAEVDSSMLSLDLVVSSGESLGAWWLLQFAGLQSSADLFQVLVAKFFCLFVCSLFFVCLVWFGLGFFWQGERGLHRQALREETRGCSMADTANCRWLYNGPKLSLSATYVAFL